MKLFLIDVVDTTTYNKRGEIMKTINYDKEHLYECPVCEEEALYIHDHNIAECKSCNFKGKVKKDKRGHEDEPHVDIEGVVYRVKQKREDDDEKICIVVNNEYICVDKHSNG